MMQPDTGMELNLNVVRLGEFMPEQVGSVSAVVFDLDGTLAESKDLVSSRAAYLIGRLIDCGLEISIISGASDRQFARQVMPRFRDAGVNSHLHLLPACGTRYLAWDAGIRAWKLRYAKDLRDEEKREICSVLLSGVEALGLSEPVRWGPLLEDCSSQVTYSGLGQFAPADIKRRWDPDGSKRKALCAYARYHLNNFEVHSAGYTSVEVTPVGMDKAFGIEQLMKYLGVRHENLLYVADGFGIDGSDVPVARSGVPSVWVHSVDETVVLLARMVDWFGRRPEGEAR